ncbi:MAG: hypothetical protein Q7K57_31880 [Burkholderiaceae bacterium]|nr:hypothetical protein [Burkholderiaceae bacterium]
MKATFLSRLQKLAGFQKEIQFEVLRRLRRAPQIIQRSMAKDVGGGLGDINLCLQTLVEKSLVEMQNVSRNTLRYVNLPIPAGAVEREKLNAEFLRQKVVQYETLRVEIGVCKSEREIQACSQKGRRIS